jgi:hypothetical protein
MRQKKPKVPKRSLEPKRSDGRPRCQAVKRNGEQCNGIARTGFTKCWMHGPGSAKREREGRAKPAGRPPITGIYSVRRAGMVQEMLEQALELERDLDNTDREITLARVLLQNALSLQPDANELRDALRRAIDDGQYPDPVELMQAARLYSNLSSYLQALAELNKDVVRIAKMRADIVAKTAQAKALEQFIEWTKALKVVLLESLPREQYEAVLERIKREVLGPLGAPKALDA